MENTIINADDFGRSSEVNEAVKECFKQNYIQRASLMVNMPGTKEAIAIAKQDGFMDKIGLHINIVEGKPLCGTTKDSFLCTEGVFNSCINKRFLPAFRILLSLKEKRAIYREVEAQMRFFREQGFKSGHFDSHRHSHMNLGVLWTIRKLIIKYAFSSFRTKTRLNRKSISNCIYSKIVSELNLSHTEDFYSYRDYMGENDEFDMKGQSVELSLHPYMSADGIICDSKGELFGFQKSN